MKVRSTTILGLIHNGKAAMAGDGQVSYDDTVLKATATKIRTMDDGKILAGFAGGAADALALFELFECAISQIRTSTPYKSKQHGKATMVPL